MNVYKIPRFIVPVVVLVSVLILAACGSDNTVTLTPTPHAVASDTEAPDPFGFPEIIQLEEPVDVPSGVPEELKTVWEVWFLLTKEHFDRANFDPEIFTEAAIRGLLQAVDDPHTSYISPGRFGIENDDIHGSFEGIGATVSMRRDGKIQVVSPIEGGPAAASGLRPGDVILEVDGESITGLSLLEAVAKIRGPRGSTVILLVLHLGAIDPVAISIERDEIPLTSVLLRSEPGDRIAHIRITSFFTDTSETLAETIQEAVDSGAEALILDVRDNPGGLLASVVDVASQFLEDGLVLYEIDGSNRRTDWKVRNRGTTFDIPMVLLANEGSASASEILAGALQDHNRAVVIGTTTFGKGSVGLIRELDNGGGLFLTFARWFTPAGRLIHEEGVEPDIEVSSRDRQKAETMQLEKAFEVLESRLGTQVPVTSERESS